MPVIEVSVLRSAEPAVLWCLVTMHGTGEPTVGPGGEAGGDTAPPESALRGGRALADDALFATGEVPSLGSVPPVIPRVRPLADDELPPGLWDRLLADLWLNVAMPRWYVLGELERPVNADGAPDAVDVLKVIREALSSHACHSQLVQELSARPDFAVLNSGRHFLDAGRTGAPERAADYYPQLLERIGRLAHHGYHAPAITRCLRNEGFTQALGRDDPVSLTAVQRLLREGLRPPSHERNRPDPAPGEAPGADEWWLRDLAAELSMPAVTLYKWIRKGWITTARKESRPPYRWIIRATPDDVAALRKRRAGERT
jgi:hypothetical protein